MLKPPVPSYSDLIPLLLSHELRNKSLFCESANPNLAFVGQRHFNRPQARRNSSSFSSRGRGFTQAANRLKYNSRPPHTAAQKPSPTPNHSAYQLHCQICKKKNHDALQCWHRFDNSFQSENVPEALAALHLNDYVDDEWIPDTGATSHITDKPGSQDESGDGIRE
ncbi:hypothetical protein ACHQM5_022093 [Ranunculus cassubicifolius]